MDQSRKAVLERIEHLKDAIAKAHEYLESGKHAGLRGFRPLFSSKTKDGKVLPPHRDWVKHVFLPRIERALKRTEARLERLNRPEPRRAIRTSRKRRIANKHAASQTDVHE